MTSRIYLLQHNGTIQPLDQQQYDSEALLQRLLAEHPDILAGEQINTDAPRRLLLVQREAGIPAEEGGGDHWSVDHLFLDQEGVPTLVEVKRSTDARIRREVVGQMLDYAANAVVYWPVETIQARLEVTCGDKGLDPRQAILDLIGTEADEDEAVDEFWRQVSTNLHAGRVRMLFVADVIPPELRRVVEFLNSQMDQAEVLAVEISQFVGEGLKTLVPRVIGQTEAARQSKQAGLGTHFTTREEFLGKCGPAAQRFFDRVLSLAQEKQYTVYWGRVGFSVRVPKAGRLTSFAYGYPPDIFEFQFYGFLREPQVEPRLRNELLASGVLEQAGQWTLRAKVKGENLERLNKEYDLILAKVGELAETSVNQE